MASEAAEITRRAKSNLAFALSVLPPERRDDAVTYYAFCRTLDDLADEPSAPVKERRKQLERWRMGLLEGFSDPDSLQREVAELMHRYQLPGEWLAALADGCIEDLSPQRYPTWEDLDSYIWKVAGAVGLVSARLFGCSDPSVNDYAEKLARALQLTNILRDVGEDWANEKRLYLPLEELERHGVAEIDLDRMESRERLHPLFAAVAERAQGHFAEAQLALPQADFKALLPARIMAAIYQDLLKRMKKDGLRVMECRYRVPGWRKFFLLVSCRLKG